MMAEFQEVIKQWGRMCDACVCKNEDVAIYPQKVCPLLRKHEGFPCDDDPKCWSDECTKQFEDVVMAWAAEHPEPVYPTWGEWLFSIGAAKRIPTGNPWPVEMADGSMIVPDCEIVVDVNKPIPADIAQKLGIEPKEG